MVPLLLVSSAVASTTLVAVHTTAPLDVGLGVRTELPRRVQVGARLGYLPSGYVSVFNGVATALDAYDQSTADLIAFAIQRSAVASVDAGWRPFDALGLRWGIGYSLAALGGDATGAEVVSAAAGIEVPSDTPQRQTAPTVQVGATVHFLRPELGWTLAIGDRGALDLGVGGLFTVGSKARVTLSRGRESGALSTFASDTEDWLETTLNRWVHSPTVSVAFGLQLGQNGR